MCSDFSTLLNLLRLLDVIRRKVYMKTQYLGPEQVSIDYEYFMIYYCPQSMKSSYNQGKCVLAYNSHLLCGTVKNLICTHSLNCAESRDIGHAHFCFFPANLGNDTNLFFELLAGNFTDLQETLHTASVGTPDKKVCVCLCIYHIPNNTEVTK